LQVSETYSEPTEFRSLNYKEYPVSKRKRLEDAEFKKIGVSQLQIKRKEHSEFVQLILQYSRSSGHALKSLKLLGD